MSGTANYPNLLAGGLVNESSFAPFELWAGESDLVTSQGTCGTVALEQFRVIARAADNTIVPWDPTQTDSRARAIGFMAQPAAPSGAAAYYTGGVPNHLALVWPATVTTLDARKAAFDRSNITISALL